MPDKIEVTDEMLAEINAKIQTQETTYAKEAQKLGMDRTTLSKKCKEFRDKHKTQGGTNLNSEDIKKEDQQEDQQKEPAPIINEMELVIAEAEKAEVEKVTFTISKDLIRALKLKAANEDLKIIEVVKKALYCSVEPKYFKKI